MKLTFALLAGLLVGSGVMPASTHSHAAYSAKKSANHKHGKAKHHKAKKHTAK